MFKIRKKAGVVSYQEVKELACKRDNWKKIHIGDTRNIDLVLRENNNVIIKFNLY